MPEIFPTRIISFSSEDKVFPAANLLKKSSFSKWKSEKGGNKQEVVEFDFGQPVEFSRLDIGNNGSAFIEVLVRRSASSDEPTVLLPSASFMSPVEAKNETNLNRVRVFSRDSLSKSAVAQKWDVAKFVCSQPFNKTSQYGLSFISFHSPSVQRDTTIVDVADKSAETKLPDVGVSLLEDDDLTISPDLQPGSLFFAAKRISSMEEDKQTCPTASVAQKLRAADSSSSSPKISVSTSSTIIPSASCSSSSGAGLTGNSSSRGQNLSTGGSQNTTTIKKTAAAPSPSVSSASTASSRKKRKSGSNSEPLTGVVFSLSGYQNPLRSELRDKALSLGASFRQNWTNECTHLVCAFQNTPKFNQVKGHGIIVSDKWITKCYDTHRLVDWRPYRVGRAPSPRNLRSADSHQSARNSASEEQDDEDPTSPLSETSSSPSSRSRKRRRTAAGRSDDDTDWRPGREDEEGDDEEDEAEDAEDTDSDQEPTKSRQTQRLTKLKHPPRDRNDKPRANDYLGDPDDQDTDDEIEKAVGITQTRQTLADPTAGNRDVLEELPDIFEGKHFFIHNRAIPVDEERLLRRLILAFAGNLHTYMHPEVHFVVSRSPWSDEFDEALKANDDLVFVRPDWVIACDQEAALLAHDKFLITP